MKKVIKNYLTQLKENDKKGFSLVELIIVMAIMAILVGIVASQVLPYMEKSRQSKDQQQLSGLVTDMVSAISQSDTTVADFGPMKLTGCTGTWTTELGALRSSDGSTTKSLADIQSDLAGKFGSKAATKNTNSSEIWVEYKSGTVFAWVKGATNGADTYAAAKANCAKLTVESE